MDVSIWAVIADESPRRVTPKLANFNCPLFKISFFFFIYMTMSCSIMRVDAVVHQLIMAARLCLAGADSGGAGTSR